MNAKIFLKTVFEAGHLDVPETLLDLVAANASLRHYKKKETIISVGEEQTSLYFLVSGSIMCFSTKNDGHILVNNFFYQSGSPFLACTNLNPGDHALDTILALEETELLTIPLSVINEERENYPIIDKTLADAMGQSFKEYVEILKVRGLRPADRCKWLRENHPELEKHVQKQYLAAYLDMDKAMYSRYSRRI